MPGTTWPYNVDLTGLYRMTSAPDTALDTPRFYTTSGTSLVNNDWISSVECVSQSDLIDKFNCFKKEVTEEIASKVYNLMKKIVEMPLTEEEFLQALLEE